eukprot:1277684-Amphidinium_carterae.1
MPLTSAKSPVYTIANEQHSMIQACVREQVAQQAANEERTVAVESQSLSVPVGLLCIALSLVFHDDPKLWLCDCCTR